MQHFSGEFWPYVTVCQLGDELIQLNLFYAYTVHLLLVFYYNQQMHNYIIKIHITIDRKLPVETCRSADYTKRLL